jgi:hypothetical protein
MTTATAAPTEKTRTFGVSRSVPAPESSAAIRKRGWGGVKAVAASIGSGDMFFKIEEQKKLMAFVNEDPFDWHACHWLDWITEGSKSVICWDSLRDADNNPTMPERCALCLAGDKPKKLSVFFNVISLEDPETPILKVLEVGKMVSDMIQDYSEDSKTSPLNKPGLFFEVSKTGDPKKPTYKIVPVKARDIQEDYGFAPPSDDALASAAKDQKTEPVKEPLSAEKMRELVDKLP